MELAIVAIIALIVFGPKKLPELGSSLGKGMREFKSSIGGDDDRDEEQAPRPALSAKSGVSETTAVRTEAKPADA